MADNAANFTFTTQNRPSIFDVIAQQLLHHSLQPALQRIALFLSTNYPRKFSWLGQYYDETFLALNSLLQFHYLRHYDSTFSENFYGLIRHRLQRNIDKARSITQHQRDMSLLFAAILPYFKRKIDEKMALYRLEDADGCLSNNIEGRLKKFLVLSHSTLQIAWNLLTVAHYLRYMSGKTDAQLISLELIGLKLDYNDSIVDDPPGFWTALFNGQFSVHLVRHGLTNVLELIAFFLQFLQTWHTKRTNYSLTALPTVQAPSCDFKARNYQGKCPICLQLWRIPTVLPVSGYVYCFPCIVRYLRENQQCAVTHLPAKPLDVVRLYDNNE